MWQRNDFVDMFSALFLTIVASTFCKFSLHWSISREYFEKFDQFSSCEKTRQNANTTCAMRSVTIAISRLFSQIVKWTKTTIILRQFYEDHFKVEMFRVKSRNCVTLCLHFLGMNSFFSQHSNFAILSSWRVVKRCRHWKKYENCSILFLFY